MLVAVLLFLCFAYPALYAIRRSYGHGAITINHVTLFTLGFLSYWILPIGLALILGPALRDTLGGELIDRYSDASNLSEYLMIAGLIYLSFVVGDVLARKTRIRTGRQRAVSENLLFLFSLMVGAMAVGAMFAARDMLLKGSYIADSENPSARGTTAAACILLLLIGMIHLVQTRPLTLKSVVFNRYMLLFWPTNLILLLSGTRLYFLSFAFMLMVFWTNFVAPIRLSRLLPMVVGPLLLMGVVGAYRLGDENHSIITNLIAEPLFTSFSLADFLQSGHFFLWKTPVFLVADLPNLIPSVLWPKKIPDVIDIPYVYSPMGGLNSFVSFQWNFGVIGTMLFMFFTGYALGRMRRRQDLWSRVAYIMTSGWLAFTFFRDPFSVSLVKNILEFSLLLPAAVIWIARFVAFAAGNHQPLRGGGPNGAHVVTS